MEGKKISFGFMKTKKVEKLHVQEKKDFIECVEEKAIKVVGGDEIKEIAPLVIPMKPNTLITTERLKEIAEKVESALEEPDSKEEPTKPMEVVPENETLEQMAVRELMEESKKAVKVDVPQLKLVLPVKSVSGGEKESTLGDYESVPVQEFGLAMLRGMGWSKTNEKSTFKQPALRPKGLGLGADKVVKKNMQKLSKNSKEEELSIIKNAYVKITTGKHSGYYGKVVSLDEDNGRVMVDIIVKKEMVSLSEFMMHPVTKSEFDKESKVINAIFEELSFATNPILFVNESNPSKDAGSFEQYKKNEEQKQSKNVRESRYSDKNKKDEGSNSSKDNNNHKRTEIDNKSENRDSRERNQDRSQKDKYGQRSVEKYSTNKKKYSSNDSLNESDSERNKAAKKSMKHYSSMESLDSDAERREERKRDGSELKRSGKPNRERKRHDFDSDFERNSRKDRIKECTKDSELKEKIKKERKKYDSDSEQEQRKSKKDKERKRYDSDSEPEHKSKRDKERKRQDSDSEKDKSRSKKDKERKRYDSDSDSDSEAEQRRKKDKKKKKYDSDSESDQGKRKSSSDGKRDNDKKRKGKKKKRDRDRSPNYKKHRK